jgi:hypothetical protein
MAFFTNVQPVKVLMIRILEINIFFYPMPPHVRHGLRGLPPGCG